MYQIDVSSAAATQPASTSPGTAGFFTDGNPVTGVAATIVPAEFLNSVMMEMLGVLTAANITPDKTKFSQLSTAIKALIQSGAAGYVVDTGAANAYAAAYTPAITALSDGMVLRFKAANANTGASTFNPNGLGTKPIVGGAHAALQGGEIVANSDVWLQYNSSIGGGSWILVDSTGGALQVTAGAQSSQAINLGQFTGSNQNLATPGYQKLPGGLIIQWGSQASIAAGGSATVTLPIAMPNTVLRVVVTVETSINSSTPAAGAWSSINAASFTLRNLSASIGAFSWIAIGY